MEEDEFNYILERASVNSRESLIVFMQRFLRYDDDRKWENKETSTYLDALVAVVDGIDGLYENRGEILPETPTWKMIAEILTAATVYE